MCDDDEDRAAGTIEVTRGGGGDGDGGGGGGGGDSWETERYQSPQDAADGKISQRRNLARSPRIGSGRLVGGPMTRHDGLTARVAGTLTSRSRPLLTTLTTLLVALSCCCARASEFPERECCDLPYPIPEPTGRSTSAPTPTGRSGSGIKVPMAILNCLYARQLCYEDPSCSAILEIIPRVCGPELVACSTVTVKKCQAALRTLQAFTFFRPTCLCREPHVDPDCNSFQNFLFDHPCDYVEWKDKDPYPIDALPTCNHALNLCQRGKPCNQIYKDFRTNCKIQDGQCRMENRDACQDSWTQLRLSPMFGCICPNNHIKRRCDKIFSAVNHNPCVEVLPSSTSVDLSGTDSALYPFDPQQENYQEIWLPPTSRYPYFLYPGTARTPSYYDPDSTYDIREPGDRYQHHHRHGDRHHHQEVPELPGRPAVLVVEAYDPRADSDGYETDVNRFEDRAATSRPGADHPDRSTDKSFSSSPSSSSFSSSSSSSFSSSSSSSSSSSLSKHDRVSGTVHLQPQSEHDAHPHQHRHHHHQQHQHHHHRQHPALPAPPTVVATLSSSSPGSYAPAAARPTPTVLDEPLGAHGPGHAESPRLPAPRKFAPRPTYEHRAIFDRADDDLDDLEIRPAAPPVDRFFDLLETVEGSVDQVKVIAHPDNSSSLEVIESQLENPLIDHHADHHNLFNMKQIPIPGHHHRTHHKKNQTDDFEQTGVESPSSDIDKLQQPVKVILSSTCQHAYTSCKNDPECKNLLQPVLNHCDSTTCARNECMEALQHFYKTANHKHSVEIAFCLCRKTDSKKDECIIAQEKMHPTCAQRIDGAEMPTCHSLAETCKENRSCRLRLEYYEQSCAVDSVTKKCAGPTSECRKAMLGILGTELHTNCACKGTELNQLYGCLGWQRLLWVNPCVVESQKDYHARRKHHHSRTTTAKTTTTTTAVASTTRSPTSTTATTAVEQVEDNQIPEVTRWPTTEPTETWEITTTTISTTPSTTTTTTPTPRFCIVQRPRQSHQYIREGKGKRLYRDDEPECSELCHCGEGEQLVCNTICVDSSPCKTDFAFYNHEAPAYQAHRGPCLCYSGGFICMRPSPDTYSIPHGVFMFLGYSEKDETLLKQHNNVTVLDAVSSLDNFMREEVNNQTVCTLFLYNATRENVIAVARLGTDNPPLNSSQAQSLQHLLRVKEECASMMQDLSDKINNKHHEVHTHPLLSIFKMAEVEVKMPYNSEAAIPRSSSALLVILFSIGLFGSTCLFGS